MSSEEAAALAREIIADESLESLIEMAGAQLSIAEVILLRKFTPHPSAFYRNVRAKLDWDCLGSFGIEVYERVRLIKNEYGLTDAAAFRIQDSKSSKVTARFLKIKKQMGRAGTLKRRTEYWRRHISP